MKRRESILTIAALCVSIGATVFAPSLSAQSIPMSEPSSLEKPEFAYHLFSNWADNYQDNAKKGKTIASTLLYSGAAIGFAGSALSWFGGDAISNNATGSDLDPTLKQNLTIGFGASGAALLLSGIIVSAVPIKDYRAIYADVFQERDPEVREAMAASALRYQADQGKERRISSFVTSCVVPIIVGAITAGVNVAQGKTWSDGVLTSLGNSSWWMAGGIVSLINKSPEERLYDRYLSARDAFYANR
jgi:hypothetical protein